MVTKIGKNGDALDGTPQSLVIRKIAQDLASLRVASQSDLTDNSAGTSGGATLAAIGSVAAFTATGTDLAPKAGFDTALGTARNALKTIHSQMSAMATLMGVDLGFTYNGGGTDGTGTVAAVTKALTAVDGTGNNGLAFSGTNTIITNYANAVATLVAGVNKLRTAVGLSKITDNSGGSFQSTVAALAVTTGSGVAGTSLSGVEETDAEGVLTALANAAATLAAALNAVSGTAQNIRVVAV